MISRRRRCGTDGMASSTVDTCSRSIRRASLAGRLTFRPAMRLPSSSASSSRKTAGSSSGLWLSAFASCAPASPAP